MRYTIRTHQPFTEKRKGGHQSVYFMQSKTQNAILRFVLVLCVLFALCFLFTERNGTPHFLNAVSAHDAEQTEVTLTKPSKRNTPSTRISIGELFLSEAESSDMEKCLQKIYLSLARTADACRTVIEKRMRCPGYSDAFVATLTEEEQAQARAFYEQGYVFYRQNWSVLKDQPYGAEGNNFGECGCGPTVVAQLISNLAKVPYTPEDARLWAYENGGFIASSGATTYKYMFDLPAQYGIKVHHTTDKDEVYEALQNGKLILVCVGKGDFTFGSHFMLYRGVTEKGEILISDSYSFSTSSKPWTWERLFPQVKDGYYIYETE